VQVTHSVCRVHHCNHFIREWLKLRLMATGTSPHFPPLQIVTPSAAVPYRAQIADDRVRAKGRATPAPSAAAPVPGVNYSDYPDASKRASVIRLAAGAAAAAAAAAPAMDGFVMLTAKQAKDLLGTSDGGPGQQQASLQKKKDAPVLLLSAKQLEREAQEQQQQQQQQQQQAEQNQKPAPQQQQSQRSCVPVTTIELPFSSESSAR
jgi:hypothetical protein